jgi:hypothetical protein
VKAKFRRSALCTRFALVATGLLVGSTIFAGVDSPHERGAAVIAYTQRITQIDDPDPGPSLEVYGDGRVAVHYPYYMTRAGEYALLLAPGELDRLLRSVSAKGVLEFDEASVKRQQEAIGAQRRERIVAFDAATSVIEARLGAVEKRISWYGLGADAASYPEIEALQKLAEFERQLRGLMEREDLERLD